MIDTLEAAKRWIVIVFGFTILLIGIALLVLPGPGIVIILIALAVLAGEFVWARKLLKDFEDNIKMVKRKIKKEIKKAKKSIR